jgi:hypothetical protein
VAAGVWAEAPLAVVEFVTEPMATAVKPALRTAAAIIGLIFINETSYPVGKGTD